MLRSFLLGLSLMATVAAPVAAQGNTANLELLEKRLRACIAGGAPGAPKDSLLAAIIAVRSLCYTQINRVKDARLHELDRSFGLPEASLTARQRNELSRERELATRRLNHEIGMAVSNATGLAE